MAFVRHIEHLKYRHLFVWEVRQFRFRVRQMSTKIWHQNDRMFVQKAMIRSRLCQLGAHQTHKNGCRHRPGIVTVTNTCAWCRNIYRDRRATYLHHQQSWKRGYCTEECSHLHTVVIPINTSCSHCDQHFESFAMFA